MAEELRGATDHASRGEDAMAQKMEMPMEALTVQSTSRIVSTETCVHGRLIDEVLTRDGRRTGKVHCVECGAQLDDPYHGLK
jgi:hypothetical protein